MTQPSVPTPSTSARSGAVPYAPIAAHNSYHNHPVGAVPNPVMLRPDAHDTAFVEAANRVLEDAAELARLVVPSHQSAATIIVAGDWSTGRKYFSLSDKYAAWADYGSPAVGVGAHAWLLTEARERALAAGVPGAPDRLPLVVRYTNAELDVHPSWIGFGTERGKHPPMRGWMAAPIVGRDAAVWGLLQLSDKTDGTDYSADDEAAFARFGRLVTATLEALWDVRELQRAPTARDAAPTGEPTP